MYTENTCAKQELGYFVVVVGQLQFIFLVTQESLSSCFLSFAPIVTEIFKQLLTEIRTDNDTDQSVKFFFKFPMSYYILLESKS